MALFNHILDTVIHVAKKKTSEEVFLSIRVVPRVGYRFAPPLKRDACEHESPFSLRRTNDYDLQCKSVVGPNTRQKYDKSSVKIDQAFIMVPRVGFEPTTLGLEVLCSIQLSYQGAYEYYT